MDNNIKGITIKSIVIIKGQRDYLIKESKQLHQSGAASKGTAIQRTHGSRDLRRVHEY